LKPHLEIVHPHAAGSSAPKSGPNCRAEVLGKYCHHCGESTKIHSPTAGEFLHEFIGHFIALEGKLLGTVRALVLSPGRLTADFLHGRRVPYINPLRLYLTLSLVMFGLIKLYGVDLPKVFVDSKEFGATYSHDSLGPRIPGQPEAVNLTVKWVSDDGKELGSVRTMSQLFGRVNETWAKNLDQFMSAPADKNAETLNHGFLANLPYMLIGSLPLFALYLKVIYWRSQRHYGEHLVFAMNFTAFVFLLASLMILMPGNLVWWGIMTATHNIGLVSPWDWLQLVPLAWVVAYLSVALRRIYGGGRLAAWTRSLLLLSLHFAVVCCLIVGAEIIPVLTHG
jgi:hypothetical protein